MFANARLNDHGVLAGFCGFKASLVWGVGCGKVGVGGGGVMTTTWPPSPDLGSPISPRFRGRR